MKDLATIFKALADETRLQILALLLVHGELCVCDIMETLGISQSKASRHLRYLYHAGLVRDRRATIWIYYRVAERLDAEHRTILEAVRSVTGGRRQEELTQALEAWRRRRDEPCAEASCASGPGADPTEAGRFAGGQPASK